MRFCRLLGGVSLERPMEVRFESRVADDVLPYTLVVGGSPETVEPETLARLAQSCARVVAVDHGLDSLISAHVPCDLFCGDADSVSSFGRNHVQAALSGAGGLVGAVERYDPHKDYTDLSLALRAVEGRWGAVPILCTCLSGGRADHALAALGCVARWKAPVAWVEDAYSARLLKAGDSWNLGDRDGSTFSFVPLTPSAVVSEEGMEWPLDHRRVQLLDDLGISNVLHAEAHIICHEGLIAAYLIR